MTINYIPSKCVSISQVLKLDVFLEWDGYEKRDRSVAELRTKTRYSRIPLTGDQIVPCVIPEARV
jgi:hypothetical protein